MEFKERDCPALSYSSSLAKQQRALSEPDCLPSMSSPRESLSSACLSVSQLPSSCSSVAQSPSSSRRMRHRHCRNRHRPISHSSARAFEAELHNHAWEVDYKPPNAMRDEGLGDASSIDTSSMSSVFTDDSESPERGMFGATVRAASRDSIVTHSLKRNDGQLPSQLRRHQSSPTRRVRYSADVQVQEYICGNESN
eukprot:TRINITY_DN5873_c0_g1_i1.p1 TRINITY_DN5873_c0_g1~~TRINITY_DN5873_c0_g1_i1.p1  ORF type:complete len:196 (+),score=18.08 TRINITY_DN5873_c0_g1_i1:256-843(+)